jgi:hypothetical protein
VTTDRTSGARPATPSLNCPRGGLSIALRSCSRPNAHCPRCLGRNGTIVELFSSRLPAGALYADNSLPRAGKALSRQRWVM